MITGMGNINSGMRCISIKDIYGNVVGQMSYSVGKSGKKKPKRLQYNMRQISARILKSKTSGSARMALTGARSKVAQLKRQLKSEEFDSDELRNAIVHAMQIERVAKKKMKHLQEEETAKKGGICSGEQVEWEANPEEELSDELMEELVELMKESARAGGLEELSDELISAFSDDIDPDDLEEMKKKHRSEELRDILEADMKYLKAVFDRLQKEKQSNTSASARGVSLQLGGTEIPVDTMAVSDASVMAEGAGIDYQA